MAGRQKTDEKRDAILAAASLEFAHRDFHEVLMDSVAARAGVGKGTLYRYFPTKEELFLATVLRGLDEAHVEHINTFDDTAPLEVILTNAVTGMVSYFEGKEELLTLLQRYEHRLPAQETEAVQRRRSEVLEAIAGVLDREVRAGNVRALDTALAAEMLLGMVRTAVLFRYRTGDRSRATEHIASEIVSLFLSGVRTHSAPASAQPAPRERLRSVSRARAEGGAS